MAATLIETKAPPSSLTSPKAVTRPTSLQRHYWTSGG